MLMNAQWCVMFLHRTLQRSCVNQTVWMFKDVFVHWTLLKKFELWSFSVHPPTVAITSHLQDFD